MADTQADTEKRERRIPKFDGAFDGEFPTSTRSSGGFWPSELAKWQAEPMKVFRYVDVSPTTVSNLRKDHGADVVSRTEDGETVLYCRWNPDRVEAIKAEVRERAAKRQATIEKNKGNGKGEATRAQAAAKAKAGK